jgi:hypothetical protein
MRNSTPHFLCSYTEATSQAYVFDERDPYEAATADFFDPNSNLCPYCRFRLFDHEQSNLPADVGLRTCDQCGWWLVGYTSVSSNGHRIITNQFRGEAKHYRISDLDAPLEDLHRFLSRNPEYLSKVHHKNFELLVADCLKVCFGAIEVVHTGGTSDGGIDLLMILTPGETYLVQVKRRTDLSSREGVRVVRELNGVMFRENLPKGLIVTTAIDYTAAAKREARVKTPTTETYVMKLLKFDDVVHMLRLPRPFPYEPWTPYATELSRKISMDIPPSRDTGW